MRKEQDTPRRRFLKHGVLVLLPLVLLTVMAVSWLRQDRLVVWESAKEVAKLSSNESARRIQERIKLLSTQGASNSFEGAIFFKVAEDGRLVSPRPRDLFPVPKPYPVEQLSAAEKALWVKATAADAAGAVTERSNAWSAFLAGSPTNDWRALGRYHLAMALAPENPIEASRLLKEVFTTHTEVQLESGLPLLPLAEWRWMELNSNQVTSAVLEHFFSNAVAQASVLTQDFIGATTCRAGKPLYYWLGKYQQDEMARRLYASGKDIWREQGSATNSTNLHWISADASLWLLLSLPGRGGVTALRFGDVANVVKEELKGSGAKSSTLVYEVKLAGKVLVNPFNEGEVVGNQVSVPAEAEALTTATVGEGKQAVEVTAFFWQNSFYRTERRERFLMFTAIITLAVVAALTGLASAFRTFQEQWRLSEMKSNFVSSVSHELRAPLASVRLMAESLERGKVNEPARQQEYFQLIGRECRRLTALIENVLDFARMDQGRKQYEMEPTDLVTLMQHTVKGMEAYAAERTVRLKLEIEGEAREVEMDGQAMQQAVINLIDNAVKYSPEKGEVGVKLSFEDECVHIGVQDEGPGIPQWERKRIFERFYRSGKELRRETQGVGIGLSIVKHVVEAHGGIVGAAESRVRGSFFVITLPVGKRGNIEPVALVDE